MGLHFALTIYLHGDGQGTARYHGTAEGNSEWPPAPARVFQALVSGSARGNLLEGDTVEALRWFEHLSPPVIAAPRAVQGKSVSLFVPNNDGDAVDYPHEIEKIRVEKTVRPMLVDERVPVTYFWELPNGEETAEARAVAAAAEGLYQLGRGVDMAWATSEVLDDDTVERRLIEHRGTVHRPDPRGGGKALPCPIPGSLASLIDRHRAKRLRLESEGNAQRVLFTNAPKPRFRGVSYERARSRVLFELREREDEAKTWRWPLHRVVSLVEGLRDSAAERLRRGLPSELSAVERALVGRKADGSDSSPTHQRLRIVPLPSIGHEHVDQAIRRFLLEIPSGALLAAADIEWAFSGLDVASPDTGVVAPFVVARTDSTDMLRRYEGPSQRWRSITAVALSLDAQRRRIEPARRDEESKDGHERSEEEARATRAVHVALRHAGIRATAVAVRVQREPFDANGARVEAFAPGTRFAKERLWHVELELDRRVYGPLVLGDGRFLGLGVMAPVSERRSNARHLKKGGSAHRARIHGNASTANPYGIFGLALIGDATRDAISLGRALRRAVMARVQSELGHAPLPSFFTGHEESGERLRADRSSHLAYQFDPVSRRLIIIAPHWLDGREPSREERHAIEILDAALEGLIDLRAGKAGRFNLRREAMTGADPLLAASRSWVTVTPYAVTRHEKCGSANEALEADLVAECHRRNLPTAEVKVLAAHGVTGQGLEGSVRLDFTVAVSGPILLGRTRYLGGGLFAAIKP